MADQYTAEVGVDTSDLQKELARSDAALKKFAANFDTAAAAMQRFQRAQAAVNARGITPTSRTNILGPNMTEVTRQVRELVSVQNEAAKGNLSAIQAQEKAYASYSKNISVASQTTRDMAKAQKDAYATYAPNIRASQAAAQAERERANVFAQSSQAQSRYAAEATRNGVAYGQEVSGSLNSTRYALYDVATTWGMVSAATLASAYAVEKVGIAYESAFTGVERTSGAAGAQINEMRDALVDMSTSMPSSFEDIAGVATLGGQLGIATEGIEDFTETVIQMGATTNLTMEEAGTAFGRFKALLGTPEAEFSNLGSAILKVGVNSAATETQIVNIATQISSLSNLAGLTADQTVGLAGALASVGRKL